MDAVERIREEIGFLEKCKAKGEKSLRTWNEREIEAYDDDLMADELSGMVSDCRMNQQKARASIAAFDMMICRLKDMLVDLGEDINEVAGL